MAYVAVDKDGRELKCSGLPHRDTTDTIWLFGKDCIDVKVLEKGSVEKLIGKKLTWEDEPVELKE